MARRLRVFAAALFLGAAAAQAAPLPDGLPALPDLGERVPVGDLTGLALDGYDPVAYHLTGGPVAGSARHELVWANAVWRFASEANRQAFLADPDAFMPKYNGYDAREVTLERPVKGDPQHFAIVDGRLHLFRSADNRRDFLRQGQLQQQAEARWTGLERQLTR